VQIEVGNVKDKINELISDSQRKFQRVDFELSNVRTELKEVSEKNNSFKSDLMNALRDIKEICRTNSTAINKLNDDVNIIKSDLLSRIESLNRHNDDTLKQIHENNMELAN